MKRETSITRRQQEILYKLYLMSQAMKVYTVNRPQSLLAKELGITRQALSMHLHRLREEGFIRTGRGFVELTSKALELLGVKKEDSFIFVRVEPRLREQVYASVLKMPVKQVYRVTGDVDLILVLEQSALAEVLRDLSKMTGVTHTSSHVVIEVIKE
ncbi:MAG: Lrp/AsnC family transcriptional regulator [Candidatus Nezhaarchaeota archaeon]|nr:Lrp/AsnC family transcriptional regulator [Candidatus Nezhaarchaeota archaeon]